MLHDVGAFIVLQIQGHTRPEILVEVVKRIEIESDDTKRARHHQRVRVFGPNAFLPCGTVNDKVVTYKFSERRPEMSSDRKRAMGLFTVAQEVSDAYRCSQGVDSRVRITGVSV